MNKNNIDIVKNISNYKILLIYHIKRVINCLSSNALISFDEIYNCHVLIYNNNNKDIYRPLIFSNFNDFSIHTFIYYLLNLITIEFKRRVVYYDYMEYEAIDIISDNLVLGYNLHMKKLISILYDFLNNNVFLSVNMLSLFTNVFDKMFNNMNSYVMLNVTMVYNYNLLCWTVDDFIHNLDNFIDELHDNTTMKSKYYDKYQHYLSTLAYDKDLLNSNICYTLTDVIFYLINKRLLDMNMDVCILLDIIVLYKRVLCNNNIKCYKDELLMVAWHPDRFMKWCISIDDFV